MLCKLFRNISELETERDAAGRRLCKNFRRYSHTCLRISDNILTLVLECETPSWNLF